MNGIPEAVRLEYAHDANLLTGIETGKVKLIPLTKGKYALVDEEDYEQISKYNWCASHDKYTSYAIRRIVVNERHNTVKMHREVMGLSRYDGKTVDHKNRNGCDNRKENLHLVTLSFNARNSKKRVDNRSGYRGVNWHTSNSKWIAQITLNRTVYYLGVYDNIIEAALAYDRAAIKYWGTDTPLNFPSR